MSLRNSLVVLMSKYDMFMPFNDIVSNLFNYNLSKHTPKVWDWPKGVSRFENAQKIHLFLILSFCRS